MRTWRQLNLQDDVAARARLSYRKPSATATVVIALVTLYLVWGSTYLAIRIGVQTLPPLTMASVRFLVAGLLMMGWAAARGSGWGTRRPTRANWTAALIIGACLPAGGNGFVTWGEQYINSGVAALLVALVPIWMALIVHVRGIERMRPLVGAGLVIGLAGVVLVAHPWSGSPGELRGLVAVLAAGLIWAGGSVYARRAPLPSDAVLANGMEMFAGGGVLLAAALLTGEVWHIHLERFSTSSILAVVYLVVVGSIIGFSAYSYLLKHVSSALAGTYAFVNPAVAVLLGALVLGEPLTPWVLGGGTVVIIGVGLVVAGRRAAVRAPVAAASAGGKAQAA